MSQVKVLLVQLASNGDCLFVTAIAKQIKEVDFPGCHLTWMIGSKHVMVLKNNRFVDNIIEIPLQDSRDTVKQRKLIPLLIVEARGSTKYDHLFVTDYTESNFKNWFGTTRSSLFRCYPHSLKIDPQPQIFLSDHEVRRVKDFSLKNKLSSGTYNILFECSPQSGQSMMNLEKAKILSEQLTSTNPNIKIILSSNTPSGSKNPNIINGCELTWRENAELSKYCHLLLGCSSGISWLCTTNWAKKLPTIQVIDPRYMNGRISASMKADFLFYGFNTEHIIEIYNPPDVLLKQCVLSVCAGDFMNCKARYDKSGYRFFTSYQCLKDAKISKHLKLWILFRYVLFGEILKFYRQSKPGWFTPGIWWSEWKAK